MKHFPSLFHNPLSQLTPMSRSRPSIQGVSCEIVFYLDLGIPDSTVVARQDAVRMSILQDFFLPRQNWSDLSVVRQPGRQTPWVSELTPSQPCSAAGIPPTPQGTNSALSRRRQWTEQPRRGGRARAGAEPTGPPPRPGRACSGVLRLNRTGRPGAGGRGRAGAPSRPRRPAASSAVRPSVRRLIQESGGAEAQVGAASPVAVAWMFS